MSSCVPSDAAITTPTIIVTTTAITINMIFEATTVSYNAIPYKQIFCGRPHISSMLEIFRNQDYLDMGLNDSAHICKFM